MPEVSSTLAAKPPKHVIVSLTVKFELNRKDGLRRVFFELDKTTDDNGVEAWKILFKLFERAKKTEPYVDPLVMLEVDVKTALNKKAETMAKDGMTQDQADHAIGPASDDAKAAKENQLPMPIAKASVEKTLKK